ncbi:MAG: V4R domain-containing protein [Thermoplasmata archaeon]
MRFVKLSQEELKDMAKFYKGVMATAYEGLFYREGKSIGRSILSVVSEGDDYVEKASKLIKARGWVEEIEFQEDTAIVIGSVEVDDESDEPTCHRLRGIISVIYENKTGSLVEVNESECASLGNDKCIFDIEIKGY